MILLLLAGRGTGDFRRGLFVHWFDPDQTHHATLWTAGGSMMFEATKYRQLGGMDELFYPAYEEDRDLSYRALKHGWKIAFEYRAKVWHQHESTNLSVFGQRQMEIVSWKNQFLLAWKNLTDGSLIIQHLLWLPYHLILSNWRTKGATGLGFWQALQQLPQVWSRRQELKALTRLTDRQVLAQAQQAPAPPPSLPPPSFAS